MINPQGAIIRDAALERLKRMTVAGRPFKTAEPIRLWPVQANKLPGLAVFILSQRANALTDGRTGPPAYWVDLNLGLSVLVSANDPWTQVGVLDVVGEGMLDLLLKDRTFMAVVDVEGARILETWPGWERTTEYFKDGEAYYAESRTVLKLGYSVYYEQEPFNILEEVVIAMPQLQDLM